MSQYDTLRQQAETLGADFFGVADLAPARDAILEQGGPVVASFPRAISVGVALMHSIVDQLPQRADRAVAVTYRAHAYDIVNARLDQITARLSSQLQAAGYRALPTPASSQTDHTRLVGIFSNKMAAHLAGLGWIGRSCLLVTPSNGPRVRWASVLTNAPLPAGQPMAPQCGDCHECVDACPVQAFTGRLFDPAEPRSARYDAHKCDAYLRHLLETRGVSVCGMCLYACPNGKRAAERLLGG